MASFFIVTLSDTDEQLEGGQDDVGGTFDAGCSPPGLTINDHLQ